MSRKRAIVDKTQAGASSRPRFDRSLGLTLFTGVAMLLVLGLVFSVAYGSKQITTNAAALHDADESLRAATVIRAQLALSMHMASTDREFGTNSVAARETSLVEADLALQDFATGLNEHPRSGRCP